MNLHSLWRAIVNHQREHGVVIIGDNEVSIEAAKEVYDLLGSELAANPSREVRCALSAAMHDATGGDLSKIPPREETTRDPFKQLTGWPEGWALVSVAVDWHGYGVEIKQPNTSGTRVGLPPPHLSGYAETLRGAIQSVVRECQRPRTGGVQAQPPVGERRPWPFKELADNLLDDINYVLREGME